MAASGNTDFAQIAVQEASSALNQQIVDFVSQSAVLTLGSSPTMAISLLYQAVAQAMGNAANNSTVLQPAG